jgi:hypothetical protein
MVRPSLSSVRGDSTSLSKKVVESHKTKEGGSTTFNLPFRMVEPFVLAKRMTIGEVVGLELDGGEKVAE